MVKSIVFNAGSIHDIPVGRGMRFSLENHSFIVYRETYGHFYAYADQRCDISRGLHKGQIKGDKICLPSGHKVDVHTGKIDHSDRAFTTICSWVENGFIFLSISSLLLA